MTNKELLQRFTEISETNLFPVQFGDGTVLTGLPPNDIYQLGFAAAFNACHLVVREFVDIQLAHGVINQIKESVSHQQVIDGFIVKQVVYKTVDQDAFFEVICEACGRDDGSGYTPDEAIANAKNLGMRQIKELDGRTMMRCTECQ